MQWYRHEYDHACANLRLGLIAGRPAVFIDNHLLDPERSEGLFLHLDKLIGAAPATPLRVLSTCKAFAASEALVQAMPAPLWREEKPAARSSTRPRPFFFRAPPARRSGRARHVGGGARRGDARADGLAISCARCRAFQHAGGIRSHLPQPAARRRLSR